MVATGCAICPSQGVVQWIDMETWHPPRFHQRFQIGDIFKNKSIPKELSTRARDAPGGSGSQSMRAGCATTLYANGVSQIDMQRWGRWNSPVYTTYVWRGNVRLRTLSYAITRRANLSDHLQSPERKGGKLSSHTPTGEAGRFMAES